MTRFARAKGSKASNERLPEEATAWHVMKHQLLVKPSEASSSTEVDMGQKSDAEKNKKNIQWSDFPDTKPMKMNEKNKVKAKSLQNEGTEKQRKTPDIKAADCKTEKQGKKKNAGKKRKLEEEQNAETDGQEVKNPKNFNTNDSNDKFKNNKKKLKSGNFTRRKSECTANFVGIHGTTIQTMYFDRFPVLKQDGLRLIQLRKDLIKKGVPRHAIEVTMKLERRRAEKALSREKSKVCFNCRQSGHNISDCPALKDGPHQELTATGICFKCGSTQHTAVQCKDIKGDSFQFATCFICKEVGHISRQCPDNSRGIYPRGGSCNNCGDVTHYKIDCPLLQAKKQENTIFAEVINDDVEALGNENQKVVKTPPIPQTKYVRF